MNRIRFDIFDGISWFNSDGQYHRLDGPAIELANSANTWYDNGQLHRLNGPAVEYSDGDKEWFIGSVEYYEEEFAQEIKKRNKHKGIIL